MKRANRPVTCDQGGDTTRAGCEASNGGTGVYTSTAAYVPGAFTSTATFVASIIACTAESASSCTAVAEVLPSPARCDGGTYVTTASTCDGAATTRTQAECEAGVGTCDQGGHTTKVDCEASNGGAGVFTSTAIFVVGDTQTCTLLGDSSGCDVASASAGTCDSGSGPEFSSKQRAIVASSPERAKTRVLPPVGQTWHL